MFDAGPDVGDVGADDVGADDVGAGPDADATGADTSIPAWGDQPTQQSWIFIWASMVAGDTRVKTINQTIASDRHAIESNKVINTHGANQLTTAPAEE